MDLANIVPIQEKGKIEIPPTRLEKISPEPKNLMPVYS